MLHYRFEYKALFRVFACRVKMFFFFLYSIVIKKLYSVHFPFYSTASRSRI